MQGGFTAPALRIGFGLDMESAEAYNATAWDLFDAAIEYVIGVNEEEYPLIFAEFNYDISDNSQEHVIYSSNNGVAELQVPRFWVIDDFGAPSSLVASGTRVVWQETGNLYYGDEYAIFSKDIDGGTAAQVSGNITGTSDKPDVDGDVIVWIDNNYDDNTVKAMVSENGTVSQLSPSTVSEYNPLIEDGNIAFVGKGSDGNWDLYLDDGYGTSVGAVDAAYSFNIRFNGQAVLYVDRYNNPGTDELTQWENGTFTVLAQSSQIDNGNFDITDSLSTWIQYVDDGTGNVYAQVFVKKNGESAAQVTSDQANKYKVHADGNLVVWHEGQSSDVTLKCYDAASGQISTIATETIQEYKVGSLKVIENHVVYGVSEVEYQPSFSANGKVFIWTPGMASPRMILSVPGTTVQAIAD